MSSTTAALAMGDALAAALMKKRKFKPADFAMYHPGGSLGKKLLTKVKDVMCSNNLPIVNLESSFQDVIHTMTSGKLGLCIVMAESTLKGIITDGDLRRALEVTNRPRFELSAKEIMSPNPKTISQNSMASDAEELLLKHKMSELIVLENEKVVGVIQLFDTGNIS